MKKKILVAFFTVTSLFLSAARIHAMDIDGWWKVNGTIQQGDFRFGEWTNLISYGKKASYMYISGAQENNYNTYGGAWFYLWDALNGGFIEEIYPYIYIKNNIICLFGPTGMDEEGNFWGNTIVLRPYGPLGKPNLMKGYYTLYDMENIETPDQFVRMGPVEMRRVNPNLVPSEVKDMQVTD